VIPEQITWLSHGLKLASPVLGYDTKQASLQHGGSRVLQNVSKFRLVLQTKQYRRKMLYSKYPSYFAPKFPFLPKIMLSLEILK